ncbi:hypothetical protein EVC12_004 [Rhizobium phage RHph_I42]|nr:hypothetical protein EVC12_004 [Rhizobium phage RHph_I42]
MNRLQLEAMIGSLKHSADAHLTIINSATVPSDVRERSRAAHGMLTALTLAYEAALAVTVDPPSAK